MNKAHHEVLAENIRLKAALKSIDQLAGAEQGELASQVSFIAKEALSEDATSPVTTRCFSPVLEAPLSEEAEETLKVMAEYCINHGIAMGQDEGFSSFGPEIKHHFRVELERFCQFGRVVSKSPQIPDEQGANRYGLDMAYFRNLFNRELNRPLVDYRPSELARVLARAARTADSKVLVEAEFIDQAREGWSLLPEDLLTHLGDFREAVQWAQALGDCDGYWAHQLKVIDRVSEAVKTGDTSESER